MPFTQSHKEILLLKTVFIIDLRYLVLRLHRHRHAQSLLKTAKRKKNCILNCFLYPVDSTNTKAIRP